MSLDTLVEISRYYGKNPDYVLAGGGNTSWKDDHTLYVKSSGTSLADVNSDSFVKMDRKALALIWDRDYPELREQRESAVLADMMAARIPGVQEKRPSVESLLHDIIPFAFVVHLHPALVNGLGCSVNGETTVKNIFGDKTIWIESINPGYVLAKEVKSKMDAYSARNIKTPSIIFMQNHGIFVGDDSVTGIREKYDNIMQKIGTHIKRRPDFSDEEQFAINENDNEKINMIIKTLSELSGGTAIFMQGKEVSRLVKDQTSFTPLSSAFTPDHIVYAGSAPLFITTDIDIQSAWKNHIEKNGIAPKIIAVQGLGIFSAAVTEKATALAMNLFRDSVKIAVYAESFGGPLFMTEDKIDFIKNWEVERYRTSVSDK